MRSKQEKALQALADSICDALNEWQVDNLGDWDFAIKVRDLYDAYLEAE